jgi:hypothetical protein
MFPMHVRLCPLVSLVRLRSYLGLLLDAPRLSPSARQMNSPYSASQSFIHSLSSTCLVLVLGKTKATTGTQARLRQRPWNSETPITTLPVARHDEPPACTYHCGLSIPTCIIKLNRTTIHGWPPGPGGCRFGNGRLRGPASMVSVTCCPHRGLDPWPSGLRASSGPW